MSTDYDQFRAYPMPPEMRAKWIAAKVTAGHWRGEVVLRRAVANEIAEAERHAVDAARSEWAKERDDLIAAIVAGQPKSSPNNTKVARCMRIYRNDPHADPYVVADEVGCVLSVVHEARRRLRNETR